LFFVDQQAILSSDADCVLYLCIYVPNR
jgi:hypothetical protein